MKYRIKLYLAFVFLIFCTTFAGVVVVYKEAREALFQELRSKVLTVATTTADLIDGDLLNTIQNKQSFGTPAFQKITKQLKEVQASNRREDLEVSYIYVIRPRVDSIERATQPRNPGSSGQGLRELPDSVAEPNGSAHLRSGESPAFEAGVLQMVIDARDQTEKDYRYPGDLFPRAQGLSGKEQLYQPWAPKDFVIDYSQPMLTAFAPVYTADEKYAGTIGVDVSGALVMKELNHLRLISFITLVFTLIIGFLAADFLAAAVTRSLDRLSKWVREIGRGDFQARLALETRDEFGELARSLNKMTHELEQHERLKTSFVRYVSQHVMDQILLSESTPVLTGERRKITVLFSDIRSFTRFAEQYPAEKVVALLNEYLGKMLDIIFANNGTLDKFIGDGLMVEFGAPLEDPQQEERAVKTAIEMQEAIKTLQRKWVTEGLPPLSMGIGIHTGFAIVGNIGSEKRMDYTAVGDTVNVAFRLEEATRTHEADILISEAVMEKLQGKFNLKKIGPLNLAGREAEVIAYSVVRPLA